MTEFVPESKSQSVGIEFGDVFNLATIQGQDRNAFSVLLFLACRGVRLVDVDVFQFRRPSIPLFRALDDR